MSAEETWTLREDADGCRLKIHVTPRASRTEVGGVHGGVLKLKVQAPPADGAANEAVVKFLANLFGVSKSRILIDRGLSSRNKTVLVAGVGKSRILETLVNKIK
jgi:uncharacterized protein (TIGR00251 family)